MGEHEDNGDFGLAIKTMESLSYYFPFGNQEYSVNLNSVPWPTPLITSHKYLDDMGLSYRTYYYISWRPEDCYPESIEMRNYFPLLSFSSYRYLLTSQLSNIHRDLGHSSIQKQMIII